MEKLKDSKWVYVILALLIAVVLWLYVGKEADPEKTQSFYNIPVTFTGVDKLEQQGMTISSGMPQTVMLRIQARNSILRELAGDGNIKVAVSVASITQPGEYILDYTIDYHTSMVGGIQSSITLVDKKPASIQITVSKRSDKSIPVVGDFTGSVADGFKKEDFVITPSTVQISGTEEEVSRVNYARVTLNQADLSETFSGEMPFTLIDYEDNPIENTAGIKTDVSTVQVTLPVVKLKEVPLRVDVIPGGGAKEENAEITIEPQTITVSGSQKDLEGAKEITLGSVDLSKVFTSDDISFQIPLAQELANVSGTTTATVHVEITGLTTRTVDVNNIDFINVPSEYSVDKVTQSRQVQIRGTQEAVDAVIPSQLRMVADFEGLSLATGTQDVPVKVYLDGSSDVGVVGSDYNIVVSITQ